MCAWPNLPSVLFLFTVDIGARLRIPYFYDAKLFHLPREKMQMGIKRDRRSLWVGISHCWSHSSGSAVVLSAMVSPPHLGSNERICPRYGSVTGRSERISRSVVRFSLSNLYADSKGTGDANRHEEGGTSQSCPGLFRAKRCDSQNNTVRSYGLFTRYRVRRDIDWNLTRNSLRFAI